MAATMRKFWRDARGATAVEYALVAGGIALAIVAAAEAMGLQLVSMFQSVSSGFPSDG